LREWSDWNNALVFFDTKKHDGDRVLLWSDRHRLDECRYETY